MWRRCRLGQRPSFSERGCAQLLLLVLGLLLVWSGVLPFLSGLPYLEDCTGSQYPFQCSLGRLVFVWACTVIVVGAAHVVAMIGVRRRRRWADWLAIALLVSWIVWGPWVTILLGLLLSPIWWDPRPIDWHPTP